MLRSGSAVTLFRVRSTIDSRSGNVRCGHVMINADAVRALTETWPMSRSGLAVCGAALLPLVLAVSCTTSEAEDSSGSASHATSTLDAAFRARAEKACNPYTTYNSRHFFTVRDFNRFAPDGAALPRVAAFLSRNPSYRTLGSDLEKLGRPDTGRAAWSAVLGDLQTTSKLMKSEIESAQQGHVAAFMRYDARLTKNTADLHVDLGKLGLSGASTCYGVQGDPLQTAPRSE